ncbi:trp repressor-binding protein WrbA [Sinisalibacter aestuarii]|uniref:Trp repressor-binding protein WrbA n=2 Tax=Sinisalibacter aestuarii TaxID=2949426 RepID=A0ABQ5LRC9_9RHOB|nr:trp repressor-binding protein WrbA [Sinisalibacter aestuarii]
MLLQTKPNRKDKNMAQPKIAIVFYSTYGTNHAVAQAAADAAREAGAEVRLRRIPETAPKEVVEGQEAWKAQLEKMSDIPEVTAEDMDWADGYFFSSPTRFGVTASQVRAFIDTLGGLWGAGKLADKTFTATTSAQNPHGGQEATILSLYTTAMHWGAIIVAPGFTDETIFAAGGNPYGFSTNAGGLDDAGKAAIAHQARRLVEMTAKIAS